MARIKIAIVGDPNSGKNAFIKRFLDNTFEPTTRSSSSNTLYMTGVYSEEDRPIEPDSISFTFCKISDPIEAMFNMPHWLNSDFFIVTCDLTSNTALDTLTQHIQSIREHRADAVIIVATTKADNEQQKVRTSEEVAAFIQKNKLAVEHSIYETSALTANDIGDVIFHGIQKTYPTVATTLKDQEQKYKAALTAASKKFSAYLEKREKEGATHIGVPLADKQYAVSQVQRVLTQQAPCNTLTTDPRCVRALTDGKLGKLYDATREESAFLANALPKLR